MGDEKPRFHTIWTHHQPHLDEIVAIRMLRSEEGEAKFPGVSRAKVRYSKTGGLQDGMTADAAEKKGILAVGIGGGRFDEHATANAPARKGECATTLVAQELGLADDPAWAQLIEFVRRADTRGKGQRFDLPELIKLLYMNHPDDPEQVVKWALDAIDAIVHSQESFGDTATEFAQKALIDNVTRPKGDPIRIVTVESDNPLMQRFARWRKGGCAQVIIQRRRTGHVAILTDRNARIDLRDVVCMLRRAEQEAKGKVLTADFKTLVQPGKVVGAEEWYFDERGPMLLNGSLTATDVPPTKLSLEQIRTLVRLGLDTAAFEPSRAPECTKGNCTSARRNPCPWYNYGLHRCRAMRAKRHEAAKRAEAARATEGAAPPAAAQTTETGSATTEPKPE